MTLTIILKELRALGSQKNVQGMVRFGITSEKAFGVSAPKIRALAKRIGKDHHLALELWKTEYHEARILAALLAEAECATLGQMDQWVREMSNWAQCDASCAEYFEKTRYAYQLPARWCASPKEFVRRAGVVMIAVLAVHHKGTDDHVFEEFFPLLKACSTDERNFVRKGVNWALRQIGKRNIRLHKKAIALSKEIQNIPSRSAAWIAADALRELNSPKTIALIQRKKVPYELHE
ncbi:MAG: DNA alkylation repair protein [Bacteroidota bacterium]